MERFAIKIDKNLRANLYKICRLCGIDNPDKVKVLDDATIVNLEDGEPELWKKVLDCIGLLITKDDKMPQFMCTLCVDKINDFFEFREMCYATDTQTRKLLGIKEEPKNKLPTSASSECKVEVQDVKQPVPGAQKPGRKRRNADMEVCSTLKEIKTDDVKDIKPSAASTTLNSAKKKRLKLENVDIDTKPSTDSKVEVQTKVGAAPKLGTAPKLGLAKKRLKVEPNLRDKKDLRPSKVSKLIKSKLKIETPPTTEDRRPTAFQLKKKKTLELLKQRKLAKQVAVVKVEKLRKASIDAKIKEETTVPVACSGSSQPKIKLKEPCTICNDSYVNKTLLDKHIKTTHIPTIARYHCVHCNETLKKNMEIKNHNLWHKLSKTPFQCGNCSESSCSIYTYSKHIRDCSQVSYIDAQVPDWHCPECQGVFETTYLFNIHACVSNTLVCPGCDKSHKWKEDFFKHIPTCAAAVHRIPSYMTPNIQVKNEAEHPSSPIPQNHAHTLPAAASIPSAPAAQSSRITPPLMDSNQCVIIPANVSLLEEAASSSPKGSCKKSKRITKKDLKRFDKLLKSTMTTLVSIKQEPPQCEVSADQEQFGSLDVRASSESPSVSPEPADDHFYNDDDESVDEQSFPHGVGTIKQEIVDEGYRDPYSNIEVNVKRELTDNETRKKGGDATGTTQAMDSQPPKPVLKLKITKEHGTLNSILLDSPKSEKKKKKKKRKEEKHREREDAKNVTKEKSSAEMVEPAMPLPEIIRVKEEIPDLEDEKEGPKEQPVLCVPSIVAATSGALQIACVSEGVNFNGADENDNRTEENPSEGVLADQISEMEHNILCSSELQEPVDVKPLLEDLIPTLQIVSVSSAEDIMKQPVKRKRGRPPKKAPISTPKILSVSSGSDVAPFESVLEPIPKPIDEPCERVDNNENVFDFIQVRVKEEILDPAFDRPDNQAPLNEVEAEIGEAATETPICDKQAEENAYIANIDFNNLSIKQEKEYIDDGLDNPLGFDDNDESDTSSDSSSESDDDGSESEREYRELPSENEEDVPNTALTTVLPPVGLHILEVRSECPSEKTECERGVPLSSDDKSNSNIGTECKHLDIPNLNSDHRVDGHIPCGREQQTQPTNTPFEEAPGDSSLIQERLEGSSCLLNSQSDLQSSAAKNDSECALRQSNATPNDPSTQTKNSDTTERSNHSEGDTLSDEVDSHLTDEVHVATNSNVTHAMGSLSQGIVADDELEKTLKDDLDCLQSARLPTSAEKQDGLKVVQRCELPITVTDDFSSVDVDFTVMPVERAQTEHPKADVEDSALGAGISQEDSNKPSEHTPSCSLTQSVADVSEMTSETTEKVSFEKPSAEAETTDVSFGADPVQLTHVNSLDFQISPVDREDLESDNDRSLGQIETDFTQVPASSCESFPEPRRSSVSVCAFDRPSPRETTPSNALQLSPKMYFNTSETFLPTSSVHSLVDSQDLDLTEGRDQSTDENLTDLSTITASHIEQQSILVEPPTSDSLTLDLPSFVETQPASAQLFNATLALDPHFSTDLARQCENADVSIDLSDMLSSSTLHAPGAVAVLPPHTNSSFSQSTCSVSDTSSIIPPLYTSCLQHMSSDANFLESNLNFTELCRNNSALSSLSDFHINPSTGGHLHNLMSAAEANSPQLISELSGITSSSASNTDLNVPVLSEEVQNLLNEDTVAANNFELNDSVLRARCSSSTNVFSPPNPVAVSVRNFTDLENVNEIAENNNNANIERELQDELGNALAAAIADRSPNDEVDENNVINENRANFDLT